MNRAVKLISKAKIKNNELTNEFEFLKALDHPHIVKLYECYVDENFYYLVEEFCECGDLFVYLRRQKSFNERKAAIIMYQMLCAINYLHSKGIIHRDIKPENITFTSENNIKLIDFGTCAYFGDEPLKQELGTIYYLAPEVIKSKYNEKADLWSAGVILYMLLCGHPPFRGGKEKEIKAKILASKVDFPTREWKHISPLAVKFIKQLLAIDPDERISAKDALENKWLKAMIATKETEETILDVDYRLIEKLTKFASSITLQKAILSFVSFNLGKSEEITTINSEFDKIDKNNDGVISRKELIECLKKIYPVQTAYEKLDEVFEEIDFNGDGNINYNEFIAVNMKKEEIVSNQGLKMAFDLFDLDGNGFITCEELKETLPIELEERSWEELMKEIDCNKDNTISFDEFKTMMVKISKLISD